MCFWEKPEDVTTRKVMYQFSVGEWAHSIFPQGYCVAEKGQERKIIEKNVFSEI